jgi:hypothetical protein
MFWKGTNAGFPGTGGTCASPINPGATCTAFVVYKPLVPGTNQEDLNLGYDNRGANPVLQFHLRGVATSPVDVDPFGVDFGTRLVGKKATRVITVTNNGTTALSGVGISPPAAPFGATNGEGEPPQNACSGSLAVGASCKITATFQPSAVESYSGAIVFNYTLGSTPGSISLPLRGAGGDCSTVGFGEGGAVALSVANESLMVTGVAEQTDRKLVVGAFLRSSLTPRVYRLDCDGSLDPSFGQNGVFEMADLTGRVPVGVAITSDAKIIVATQRPLLARLTANGAYDESFFSGGKLTIPTMAPATVSSIYDFIVAPDGAFYLGGSYLTASGGTMAAVVKFLPIGVPDQNFGSNGVIGTSANCDGQVTRLSKGPHGYLAGGFCVPGSRPFGFEFSNALMGEILSEGPPSAFVDYQRMLTGMAGLAAGEEIVIPGNPQSRVLPRFSGKAAVGAVEMTSHPTGRPVIAGSFDAEGSDKPQLGLLGNFTPGAGQQAVELEAVHDLNALPSFKAVRMLAAQGGKTIVYGSQPKDSYATIVILRVRDTLEMDQGSGGLGGPGGPGPGGP